MSAFTSVTVPSSVLVVGTEGGDGPGCGAVLTPAVETTIAWMPASYFTDAPNDCAIARSGIITRPRMSRGGASMRLDSPLTNATFLPMTSTTSRNSVVTVACRKRPSNETCAPSASPTGRKATYALPFTVASDDAAIGFPSTMTGVGPAPNDTTAAASTPAAAAAVVRCPLSKPPLCAMTDGFSIDRGRAPRRLVPREGCSSAAARRAKPCRLHRVAQQLAHRARQRCGVCGRERQRRTACDFEQRRRLRDHARRAGGHRLDHGQTKTLIERRLNGTRAPCVQLDEIAFV